MSVFRVNLNNVNQGLLDLDPSGESGVGSQFSTSIQRSVYVMGPGKTNRLLTDGQTFTDCNYWKKFAYPQVPYNEAFITVVTDDGSVYSDVPGENTYPKVYDITATAGTSYTDNQADILTDTGGYAVFAQITNTHATNDVKIRLNGVATAIFDLSGNTTQVFNAGDLSVSLIEIDNSASGAADTAVQILLSVKSVCNS